MVSPEWNSVYVCTPKQSFCISLFSTQLKKLRNKARVFTFHKLVLLLLRQLRNYPKIKDSRRLRVKLLFSWVDNKELIDDVKPD